MTLILGTTMRTIHCGHATHQLEDDLVTCGLVQQIREELGTSWYACVTFSSGRMVMRGNDRTTPGPNHQVRDTMQRTAAKLNRDLHHKGCWIVAWHFERLIFMWRDWDGDLCFMTQIDEPWPRIQRWSVVEFCDRVETSFEAFRDMLRAVEIKPEHTIKKAQGQRPVATRMH